MQEQIAALTKKVSFQVMERILTSGYRDKLWLTGKFQAEAVESGLIFYPAKDNQREVINELQILFQKEIMEGKKLPIAVEKKHKIILEFTEDKYRIPFFVEIRPYKEIFLHPVEEHLDKLSYYRFPTEEYIARGFYEILNKLELINNLSWYKNIYDIIQVEAIDGRRVRDCFAKLLETKPIPSFEKRLETVKSYENYGYMKKKWKNEKKRHTGEFPEWNQVILLLVTFFSPIFDAIVKDEIFFDDWMPQLGRYL